MSTPEETIFQAQVIPLDETRLEIHWKPARPGLKVTVYAGDSPDAIDRNQEVAYTTGENRLSVERHRFSFYPYFELVPEEGRPLITAERRVPVQGTFNLRELGGYRGIDGRRVRWGRVFRGDGLVRVTDKGLDQLRQLNLAAIIDLRNRDEMEKSPDRLPQNPAPKIIHLPMQAGRIGSVEAMNRLKNGDASWVSIDFMVEGYVRIIDTYGPQLGKLLEIITNSDGSLFFHCAGGKDRTGLAAAVLLLALGVPRETVIEDHQLSNKYLADILPMIFKHMESFGLDTDTILPYFIAPLEAINAALDHIDKAYGSINNYLTHKAGVSRETIDHLRQSLLEP